MLLLTLFLAAAAVGCRASGARDDVSPWRAPRIIAADQWWGKGELADLDR